MAGGIPAVSLCSGGSGIALMKKHCLVPLKKLRKGVVIEWVVAAPQWLSSFGVRGEQTNGRGSYSNERNVGVRGEAK